MKIIAILYIKKVPTFIEKAISWGGTFLILFSLYITLHKEKII